MSYEQRDKRIVIKFINREEIEDDLLVATDVRILRETNQNTLCFRIRHQFFYNHDPRIISDVLDIVGKITVIPGTESENIIERTPLRAGMKSISKLGRMFYAARDIFTIEQKRLDEDFL